MSQLNSTILSFHSSLNRQILFFCPSTHRGKIKASMISSIAISAIGATFAGWKKRPIIASVMALSSVVISKIYYSLFHTYFNGALKIESTADAFMKQFILYISKTTNNPLVTYENSVTPKVYTEKRPCHGMLDVEGNTCFFAYMPTNHYSSILILNTDSHEVNQYIFVKTGADTPIELNWREPNASLPEDLLVPEFPRSGGKIYIVTGAKDRFHLTGDEIHSLFKNYPFPDQK